MLNDKEYVDYVRFTTKDSETILEQKGIVKFLKDNINIIDKVVFYGFSFSITDKAYSKAVFDVLNDGKTCMHVFYKVPKDRDHDEYLSSFKKRISNCLIDIDRIIFFDCDGVEKI